MSLVEQYPGGCYLAFNWAIERNSAARLVEAFAFFQTNGFSRIHLMLSSSGGFIEDTYYAAECIQAMPVEVHTYNVGVVQSAANILFMLGARRQASLGSTFYYHQTAFTMGGGERLSEQEAQDKLRAIEAGDRRSAEFIAGRIGCEAGTVDAWQREGRTLTAAEAATAGVVQAVGGPVIPPQALVKQIVLQN